MNQARLEEIGERAPLSHRRVIEAALRFVDDHGLEALSMRKLGSELGVEAMSLYNHVPNKDAILEGIVELVFDEIEIPPEKAEEWTDRLRQMALSFRSIALAHPNVFPLLVHQTNCTPAVMRPLEAALRSLESAGISGRDALYAYRAAVGFIMGYLNAHISGFLSDPDELRQRSEELERLPESEFREVRRHIPHIIKSDSRAEFEFGLDIFLAGLEQYLAGRPRRIDMTRR
ncbi:MAG: TetR/AcrR family transcriptional regulator C-terminal domain-containing protein [Actinomycetota bacterium]